MNHPKRFQGKSALVTGGTGGIGRAIVEALTTEGCCVVATGVTQAEINASKMDSELIHTSQLDVTSNSSIEGLVEEIDRLDILINCAGIILRQGAEHDISGFERVIDVNLTGTMRMCNSCKPLLERSRGCILNVGSIFSFYGAKHAPAYSTSKGGLVQLTQSLAIAWAEIGIRVNAIAPGWIRTDFTEPVRSDEIRNRSILDRTPMKRWGEPDDVAPAALFLCSSEAAFITGTILPIDGGYTAM